MPIVEGRGLTRTFPMPSGSVTALREASIEIPQGDYVAITGPSGCGKSTLLHLLGCVDSPTSGSLLFEGHDAARLTESARSRIRLTRVGFIFQRFFLLPMLDAWENVELPQAEIGVAPRKRHERTRDLLEYVGLSDRAHHRPAQLSGGEMQRVAIASARAISSVGTLSFRSRATTSRMNSASPAFIAQAPTSKVAWPAA